MKKEAKTIHFAKDKWRWLVIGTMIVVGVFLGLSWRYSKTLGSLANDVICNNIYIEGICMSGKTVSEAEDALREHFQRLMKRNVIFTCGEEGKIRTLEEIGLQMGNLEEVLAEAVAYGKEGSWWERHREMRTLEKKSFQLDLTYQVDRQQAQNLLERIGDEMRIIPQNATIQRRDGKFLFEKDQEGRRIDIEASLENVMQYFVPAWEYTGMEVIELVSVPEEADITTEMLARVNEELGAFTTYYTGGNNRAKNISIAASRIDGSLLMPGEEFSASDAMGSRSAENGYLEAGTYLNGSVVQSYGGGVCQVSTTLYNAVLYAEMEVTMRQEHSMLVNYVEPAKDAAVAEGSKDLKFRNNTNAPIYIEGFTEGNSVTFVIYGEESRDENRVVEYESKVLSTKAIAKKYVESQDYKEGEVRKIASGHEGKEAELWKVIYENGIEVSRERVNKSSYKMSPALYYVGITSLDKDEKDTLAEGETDENR